PMTNTLDTSTVYVNPDWAGKPPGSDPDGPGPAHVLGGDAFATLQEANNGVKSGGTVVIEGGTYNGGLNFTNPSLLELFGEVVIVSGGAPVIFNSPLEGSGAGGQNLTIIAGGGDVTFNKPVGSPLLGDLSVSGGGKVTFEDPMQL